MGINFCAGMLGFIGAKILDSEGHSIPSIQISQERYGKKYMRPRLIIDILQKDKVKKEAIIEEICDIKELEDLGLSVITVLAGDPIITWELAPYQRTVLMLVKRGSFEYQKYKRPKFMKKGGEVHKVLYDSANQQAQLIGSRAGPNGLGNIVSLVEEDSNE